MAAKYATIRIHATRHNIVSRHFQEYVDITGFCRLPSFGGANQILQYQGNVIEMAYLNNVQNGFGNQLRRAVIACCISRRAQQEDEEEVDR
jgi:hypothetical protein